MKSVFRNLLVLFFVILGGAPALHAQSNEIIDRILAEELITYGSASYLLLFAAGELEEDATLTSAVAAIDRRGDGLDYRTANVTITLGEFALLTMRVFDIRGGIAYSLLPVPRYAARELTFRGVIQGQTYPRMNLSGERSMRIIGRVLSLQEGGAL